MADTTTFGVVLSFEEVELCSFLDNHLTQVTLDEFYDVLGRRYYLGFSAQF